ncbi:MAG: F0F1 ATP synthase subunit B [Desulfuromonadales bacterium]|nr:F0F1 ATP synthase subunit B [Desulfuromonadales bacterium]NIS42488.1 F0F1 ATP synthase subunit B [Desulfuromonadales bacterium]
MDNPLVQPDPGLFIWTIATFLLLLFLLSKFAWRPLLQALERRQETIQKSLDDAEQAKKELEQVQEESNRIVAQARADADTIIANSRADASKLQEELRLKAREEAELIIKNAERQIQQQTDQSLSQIRGEAVDLSLMIASKLIQRNLTKEDNDELIEDALKQIRTPSA